MVPKVYFVPHTINFGLIDNALIPCFRWRYLFGRASRIVKFQRIVQGFASVIRMNVCDEIKDITKMF